MRAISYELAAGFFLHCLIQCCTHWGWRAGGPRSLPWVLIVQAESNLIDCVRMRHHHIEAVLQEDRHTHTQRQDTGCGEDGVEEGVISTCTTFICVTLCAWVSTWSLHVVCHRSVPDSSWWLSSTWCTRARRLFGWRGGSSWWFCCWKLSRSCNRWEVCRRPGLDSVVFWLFNFKSSV